MKYAQHNEAFAVIAILEYVGRVQDLQDGLPKLATVGHWAPEAAKHREELRLVDNRASDLSSERWGVLLKKSGEPIKIGEGVLRPLYLY